MSQNLFQTVSLVERSFFQKIFGQHPDENALIELNNLFATKSIKEITVDEVSEIENKHNINLSAEFPLNLEEFFATYLNYCERNKSSDNLQQENLKHLQSVLKLSDEITSHLYQKVGEGIYREAYDKAISDGHTTDERETALKKLETELKLTEEITNQIADVSRHNYMDNLLKKIVADGKISPDEWTELNEAAKNLKIDMKMDNKTNSQIERLKLNWQIQNGELPILETGISLQKSEVCHYTTHVDWLEHRTVTRRINYGGPRVRFKIVKGLYYSAGSVAVQRVTADQIQVIDSGTVYLTNKRVIFVGSRKNSNIRLDKILSVVPYSDGVELEKDTGKSPTLRMTSGADIFAMMISRLINE